MMGSMAIHITGDEVADHLLTTNAFALLSGMLLDQQFPMERAFAGPAKVLDRFGTLDPAAIAGAPEDDFARLCAEPPAVHRFPGSMARRIQALAGVVVETYAGDASALWLTADTGQALLERLESLPGFGRQKASIFTALLGKQLDVRPPGWRAAAGHYADEGAFRSVADVRDRDSLDKVRAAKKAQKAAAKK